MEISKEMAACFRQRLVDLMGDFISFCKANALRYFTAYGTAIGAVRHHGMIPWDDDIDVYMLRPDYERFLTLEAPEGKEIISLRTCPGTDYPIAYAKFCESGSTLWEQKKYPCVFGVFIDVFPLDAVPFVDTEIRARRKEYMGRFTLYRRAFRHHDFSEIMSDFAKGRFGNGISSVIDLMLRPWKGIFRRRFCNEDRKCMKRWNRLLGSEAADTQEIDGHDDRQRSSVGLSALWSEYDWQHPHPPGDFSSVQQADFEGLAVDLPVGNDAILRRIYGDYMQLPPENERVSRHYHYYMDLDRRLSVKEIKAEMKKDKRL